MRLAQGNIPVRPGRLVPTDPIFDKPYEPAAAADTATAPAADAVAPAPAQAPTRGLSPNIRIKKKVASLLGG